MSEALAELRAWFAWINLDYMIGWLCGWYAHQATKAIITWRQRRSTPALPPGGAS